MRIAVCLLLLLWTGAAQALTAADLRAQGFRVMDCTFTERCLIVAPCERAWRDMRWYLNDAQGIAYREQAEGRFGKGVLMKDARWKDQSRSRAIIMPMREAVASHITVFDGGGAIYSLQYAANPGSGQFLRGTCDLPSDRDITE
jgi:hypothetical protein